MSTKIYTSNGKILINGSNNKWLKYRDPLNPLDLPPHTIRAKFSSGYTPSIGDTQTLVDSTTNTWDIYKESNDWGGLFYSVGNKILEVLGANTTGITGFHNTFYNCTSLTTVPLFDTSSVTDFGSMFSSCTGLVSVPKFNTSSATTVENMFTYCTHLTSVPNLDLSTVMYADGYLKNCTALTTCPTLNFGNSLSRAKELFAYCSSLTSVPPFNISQWDLQLNNAFENCTSLIAVPAFTNLGSSAVLNSMFKGCTNVESGALAFYQLASTKNPREYYNCFYNCGSNTTTGAAELAQIPSSWGGTAS